MLGFLDIYCGKQILGVASHKSSSWTIGNFAYVGELRILVQQGIFKGACAHAEVRPEETLKWRTHLLNRVNEWGRIGAVEKPKQQYMEYGD